MSKVQICNRGLTTYLGVGRIASISEASPQAEQCSLHFDDTLQSLLESHWWLFATGRQTLAELANDRASEWAYKYQRPADLLSIRWVNLPASAMILIAADQTPDTPRIVTADAIYSNVPYAACEFTKQISDTSLFPQYFSDALSAAIASNIAMPLTEDLRRAQNAMNAAGERLDRAIALDEEQMPPTQAFGGPTYLSVRGL